MEQQGPEYPPISKEFLGMDREAWRKYLEEHGPEAYKYRRMYEEAARQLQNIYKYAERQGIDLPSPDFMTTRD